VQLNLSSLVATTTSPKIQQVVAMQMRELKANLLRLMGFIKCNHD
jgi:hypothetical protein